jgi:hypothetical protein
VIFAARVRPSLSCPYHAGGGAGGIAIAQDPGQLTGADTLRPLVGGPAWGRSMTKRIGVALRMQRDRGTVDVSEGPGQFQLRAIVR